MVILRRVLSPRSWPRTTSGAVSQMLWNWLAAAVRALSAPARATRSWRSASTGPSPGLGCGGGVASEDRSCRRLGIDRVGLAAASPVVTVRLVDLDHVQPPGAQMPGQSRTPRAGAFHPDRQHLPEAGDPAGQVLVAARRGRERRGVQQPAQLVEHDRDMDVFVGVDTGDDPQVAAICDGGHAALWCCPGLTDT